MGSTKEIKLEKAQTGIASEFYVAGELSRLGFNVTITFGNTKSIDLIVEKENKSSIVQVKGIQSTKSICWNLDKTKVKADLIFVLVNLHVNETDAKPEFFVLTASEARRMFKDTGNDKRSYLDYNQLRDTRYKNRWEVFEK